MTDTFTRVGGNFKVINESVHKGARIISLVGGTRSAKTLSSLIFLATQCLTMQNLDYICLRETYGIVKDTLLSTFLNILNDWSIKYKYNIAEQTVIVDGNKIRFWGCDNPDKFKGLKTNGVIMDEANNQNEGIYTQLKMRNIGWIILTRNPTFIKDWVDKVELSLDVIKYRSTFKDNPILLNSERDNIISYNPNIEKNVKNGTADKYLWEVYGLGMPSMREGTIFKYEVIDEIPEDADLLSYGMDWGYRDPTAVCGVYIKGSNLYIDEVLYQREITLPSIIEYLDTHEKNMKEHNLPIIADSSLPANIVEMRNNGYDIHGAVKFKGSLVKGIELIKRYKLHVTKKSVNAISELNNYMWKTSQNGIRIFNNPIDEHNHILDGFRYVMLMYYIKNNLK